MKSPTQVETSAQYVHQWLKKPKPKRNRSVRGGRPSTLCDVCKSRTSRLKSQPKVRTGHISTHANYASKRDAECMIYNELDEYDNANNASRS